METPLIKDKISLKEFKEQCLCHKFGKSGFVILFGYGKYGYKYRIILAGTKQPKALSIAYVLLFGHPDENEIENVEIGTEDSPKKMPISCNFAFRMRTDLIKADLKTMKIVWDE